MIPTNNIGYSSDMTAHHNHPSSTRVSQVLQISPPSVSFEGLPRDYTNIIYANIIRTAGQRGFTAPPMAEVLCYLSKPLPPTPIPDAVFNEVSMTMISPVNTNQPCIASLPDNLPASCSASIKTSLTKQPSALNLQGLTKPLLSVNVNVPRISTIPENVPASSTASIISGLTPRSSVPTLDSQELTTAAAWVSRMRRPGENNHFAQQSPVPMVLSHAAIGPAAWQTRMCRRAETNHTASETMSRPALDER